MSKIPNCRYRIVSIEYHDDGPGCVVALEYWDHTKEPWLVAGRDRPNGWCPQHFSFERIDGQLWWHNTGGGGDYKTHTVSKIGIFHKGKFRVNRPPDLSKLWVAPEIRLVKWKSDQQPAVPIRDTELLRFGWERVARPLRLSADGARSVDPFKVSQQAYNGFVHCKHCGPLVEGDGNPCEHMEWCDECSCFVYGDTHQREDDPDGEPVKHEEEPANA